MNRHWLREMILQVAGRLLKWSTVDQLESRFGWLRATRTPIDPAEGERSTTQDCRNMIGFGFRSAPVSGSEVIIGAPRGGAANAVVVASDHLGYGPTDLVEGDAVMYSGAHAQGNACYVMTRQDGAVWISAKQSASAILDKDGGITVTAKTGQPLKLICSGSTIEILGNGAINITATNPRNVTVNGGALRVARDTDPVETTNAMTAWMVAVRASLIGLGGLDPGLPPLTIGTIDGGAARFFA